MMVPEYQILLSKNTWERITAYHQGLLDSTQPGKYLESSLEGKLISDLSELEFLSALLNTKRPRIFAESEVRGDGSDWTLEELRLLGDISIAVPVTVYDNGRHQNPEVHELPFSGTLIYTPGALLRSGTEVKPADWEEVTLEGKINPEGYYQLYERRLLPVLRYASDRAGEHGREAFLTVPGLGCGQFAGPFRGQLQEYLKNALMRLLEHHQASLPHLKAVYYDPYRGCQNERCEIGGVSILVRPLTQGNEEKPQLCPPVRYQEEGDDFSGCDLFSIVAWDHVSWPGNDFYAGMRATDDGVKAAATDSMRQITGVEGEYDPAVNKYQPPAPYDTWEELVLKNKLRLEIEKEPLVLNCR